MAELDAFELTAHQRLICVEGGRVTGIFWVLKTRVGRFHVKPVDVSVWDSDEHNSGRILYSDDLTAFVTGDEVDIPPHMVTPSKHDDVLDAMADMEAAILAATKAWKEVA